MRLTFCRPLGMPRCRKPEKGVGCRQPVSARCRPAGTVYSLCPRPRYDRTSSPKSWVMRLHQASSSCIAPKSIHASSDMLARQARNGTASGPVG
jgi:hypothetical protein